MFINVKKLNDEAKLPCRATADSAGADLCACIDADTVLMPGERKLIPTGIAIAVPMGFGGFVFPRSGLSSKFGVSLANCVGVIDSDYRGEIKVNLINHSKTDFVVENGMRIAQFVIAKVESASFIVSEDLSSSERGEGGFGSTGVK